MMPLLWAITVSILAAGASTLWLPDDAAVTASALKSEPTHGVLVAPKNDAMMRRWTQSYGEKTTEDVITKEGSGGTNDYKDIEQEYSDDEKWLEEEVKEFGASAFEQTVKGVTPDIGVRERNLEANEGNQSREIGENINIVDNDLYFEVDQQQASEEPSLHQAAVPESDLTGPGLLEAHGKTFGDEYYHIPQDDGEFEEGLFDPIESVTYSSPVTHAIHTKNHRDDVDHTATSGQRDATVSANYDRLQVEHKSLFAVARMPSGSIDLKSDVNTVVGANAYGEDNNMVVEESVTSPTLSPILSTTSSKASTSTATVTTSKTARSTSANVLAEHGHSTNNFDGSHTSSGNGLDRGFLANSDSLTHTAVYSSSTMNSKLVEESSSNPSTSTIFSSSDPPDCLQECKATLNSFQLEVTPEYITTPLGKNISVECRLTKPDGVALQAYMVWNIPSENGSASCFLKEMGESKLMDECTGTKVTVEEEFTNQTVTISSLSILEPDVPDSGRYACTVIVICCEGTAHAQTASRSEAAILSVYTKPAYGAQLATLSVACLCFAIGILGSACFQKRRRRKKHTSGPGHVHYEPVRLLYLPQSDAIRTDSDVGYYDDDFDDGGEPTSPKIEIGSVRANPMADVQLPSPDVTPPPPEMTSPVRESRFEFPRPPSDLMKRMSNNAGFE